MDCMKCGARQPDEIEFCERCNTKLQPVKVGSIDDEYAYVECHNCDCGGKFFCTEQALVPLGDKLYDELAIRCERCGNEQILYFDISAFMPGPS